MKIYVCVKQVPDTEAKLTPNSSGTGIDSTNVKWVMNPYDEFAVEEALKLKEQISNAIVTVISVGPKQRVTDTLRTALAMGADDAIIIDAPENLDCHLSAKAIAAAIRSEGSFDLIFTGKLAIDDNSACISQMIAHHLDIPHATVVSKFTHKESAIDVERDSEGGTKEILELRKPALVAANKGLNVPRYASLPGIMKAKKKPIKEVSLSSFNLSIGQQKIEYEQLRLPAEPPAIKMIDGDAEAQAKELVRLLREEAKVI